MCVQGRGQGCFPHPELSWGGIASTNTGMGIGKNAACGHLRCCGVCSRRGKELSRSLQLPWGVLPGISVVASCSPSSLLTCPPQTRLEGGELGGEGHRRCACLSSCVVYSERVHISLYTCAGGGAWEA